MVQLANRQVVKQIDVVSHPSYFKGKIRLLYDGIEQGKFRSDEAASQALYGKEANHPAYKKLKARLEKRLINTLFFIDADKLGFDEYARVYYDCRKEKEAAIILIGRQSKTAGVLLAKKTLRKALKYKFSEIIFSLCHALMGYYGTIAGDRRKYEKYNKLAKHALESLRLEARVKEYYERLVIHSVRSHATRYEVEKTAVEYVTEIKNYLGQFQSYDFNRYAYYLITLRYQLVNDYENLLRTCSEAIRFFSSRKEYPKKVLFPFMIRQLMCQIQLKDFVNGKSTAEQSLNLVDEGSINWFSMLQYYIILSFHAGDYLKAYELIRLAMSSPQISWLPDSALENWQLYEAYIRFFIQSNKLTIKDEPPTTSKFKLSRFLNNVPTFSMDKRGYNIPVLIIQLLFLLLQKKYGVVIDKAEALHAYCHRYLRRDDTFRSNCFIKMLLMLPKANFHKENVIRKTTKLKQRLDSMPLEIARQSGEIELVPYEILWEMALEILEKNSQD